MLDYIMENGEKILLLGAEIFSTVALWIRTSKTTKEERKTKKRNKALKKSEKYLNKAKKEATKADELKEGE